MDRYQSVTFAREYLQNIISFFGENIAVSGDDDGEVITLRVESSDINSILIGRGAETLRALQYIVSSALRAQHAAIVRVSVDIADYKKQRADKLAAEAERLPTKPAAGSSVCVQLVSPTLPISTQPIDVSSTKSLPMQLASRPSPKAKAASAM